MREARIHPKPYIVKQMNHKKFEKMESFPLQSIRSGKKVGDPTVHDLCGLKYLLDGVVEYKLKFSPDIAWKKLEQKITNATEVEWKKMFPDQIPISNRKFDNLQAMKRVIPPSSHHFFDNLPCANV